MEGPMRRYAAISLLAIAISTAMATFASAMPFTRSWHESASGVAGENRAGAGGIYGTGGRTDYGIRCSHCHVEGEGDIDVSISASPAFGSTGGELTYTPGARYRVTVRMTGEHRGPDTSGANQNGMAATIEDASGRVAGRFIADAGQDSASCPASDPYPGGTSTEPSSATTFLYGDCHGVLPLTRDGLTAWTFDWIAPSAGAGDLTFFVGVVDGDTGGESSLEDDTVERAIPLREGS
jgi:hypothetical protein